MTWTAYTMMGYERHILPSGCRGNPNFEVTSFCGLTKRAGDWHYVKPREETVCADICCNCRQAEMQDTR